MKRCFFLIPLVFSLIAHSPVSCEITDNIGISIVSSQIGLLKSDDIAIDLNVKIAVPENRDAGISAVDLYATVFRHTDPGATSNTLARPTILVVTPYRRNLMAVPYIKLLDADYNIITVDIRGTGSSDGRWLSFAPEEHYDLGYLIDHYVPEQPWSDHNVGMIGLSYEGISQILAAGRIESVNGIPTHLKAVFPLVPMSDVYRDIVMHGGSTGKSKAQPNRSWKTTLFCYTSWVKKNGGLKKHGPCPTNGSGKNTCFYPNAKHHQYPRTGSPR